MDFSSMNMTAFFISLGIYIAVLALDVIVPWLCKTLSAWLNYLNIALHIAFLLSLMFVGVNIEIPVLAFMISLFAYSLSSYICYECQKRIEDVATLTEQPVDSQSEAEPAIAPSVVESETSTVETVEEGGSL